MMTLYDFLRVLIAVGAVALIAVAVDCGIQYAVTCRYTSKRK